MRTTLKIAPLLVAALLLSACQHAVNTSPQTQAQKTAVYNAALAKANLAVASGAISLEQQKTLSVQQTGVLLNYTELVANASESIRIILSGSASWTDMAAQISKVLDTVNVQKWLSSSGLNQSEVVSLLSAVSSTIALIVTEVRL
jgi:hypothetical protein